MYKDKHLQREANRKASQRRRDKQKGMMMVPVSGITNQGMTQESVTDNVIPKLPADDTALAIMEVTGNLPGEMQDNLPANFGLVDCQCRHCCNNRKHSPHLTINHGPHKTFSELKDGEVNRVSLPGDADYNNY